MAKLRKPLPENLLANPPPLETGFIGSQEDAMARYSKRLAESNLGPAEGKALQLSVLKPGTVGDLTKGYFKNYAIKIPYFDLRGKVILGFFRLRRIYDETDAPRNGKVPKDFQEKGRYWQPAGTLPQPYFPPLAELDWESIAHDPGVAIYITEGEFKAACGCLLGIPVIGLGGFWSFQSKVAGDRLLPDLAGFNLVGRKIYVILDSDLNLRADARGALYALASELIRRGAKVRRIKLNPKEDGSKVGLDDWVVSDRRRNTAAALLALPSEDLGNTERVEAANQRYTKILNPSAIYDDRQGRFFKVHEFEANLRSDFIDGFDHAGRPIKIPFASFWLDVPNHSEADQLTYRPGPVGEPVERIVTEDGLKMKNTWLGWGAGRARGDAKPFQDLLDHLLSHSDTSAEDRREFLCWLAWPFQHPEDPKIFFAMIMHSRTEGTGKTLMTNLLKRAYGERNYSSVRPEDIFSHFNAAAFENKQFVVAEEVGDEKFTKAGVLKSLITNRTVMIEKKGFDAYPMPNLFNLMILTNEPAALPLKGEDRRYQVIHAREQKLVEAWGRARVKELDRWQKTPEAAEAVLNFLLRVPLTNFDHHSAPRLSAAKIATIEAGRSNLEEHLIRLPDTANPDGNLVFPLDLVTAEDIVKKYNVQDLGQRYTSTAVGRAVEDVGMPHLKRMRVPGQGLVRLIAIRNKEKWLKASPQQCIDHYLSLRPSDKLFPIDGGKAGEPKKRHLKE